MKLVNFNLFLLGNESMNRLVNQLNSDKNFCPNSGIEDVDVAMCLRKLNVYPEKSVDEKGRERFHPFCISDHYNGNFPDWIKSYASNELQIVSTNLIHLAIFKFFIRNCFPKLQGAQCCSDTSISFHYTSKAEMMYLSYIIKSKKNNSFNFSEVFNDLRELSSKRK